MNHFAFSQKLSGSIEPLEPPLTGPLKYCDHGLKTINPRLIYINGPHLYSKSVDSISYFSKIRGFHGPHANYAPVDQTQLEIYAMFIRPLEPLM